MREEVASLSVSSLRAARPALRFSSARRGLASIPPWPITSWIRSGSGRVQRTRGVAKVLGGVEHAVGERAVELIERDEPGRGVVLESGQRAQPLRDLVELGDAVRGERQPGHRLPVLGARQPLVLGGELPADRAPYLLLLLGVIRVRDLLAGLPPERQRRDPVAPRAVLGIGEAGVVVCEVNGDAAVGVGGHRCV